MEILSTLIGYPISIFANVSTDLIGNQFKKSSVNQLTKLISKAFKRGVNSYEHQNDYEWTILKGLLKAIGEDSTKISKALKEIEIQDTSIVNLRSQKFKDQLIVNLAKEYSIENFTTNSFGRKLIDHCLKEYELMFLTEATNSEYEILIATTLNKLYNDVAKNQDIDALMTLVKTNLNTNNQILNSLDESFLVDKILTKLDNRISKPISNKLSEFNKVVEYLTEDQFRILNHQRFHNRLLIKGCAGSGKTIVACEKAIRLSKAGKKVLMTCFNPFLADYIRSLTADTNIQVKTINQIIYSFIECEYDTENNWTIYSEPSQINVNNAFDNIVENSIYFDAIIVDEGQDFSENWWIIIEALLECSDDKIMYIFADDKQNFKDYKPKYPIESYPFYLSKNVRNAGKIFELIKQFHPEAPPPTTFLEGFGVTRIDSLKGTNMFKSIIESLNQAAIYLDLNDLCILTLSHESKKNLLEHFDNSSFKLSQSIEDKLNSLLSKVSWKFLNTEVDFKISFPLDKWHLKKVKSLVKRCKSYLPSDYQKDSNEFYWQKNLNQYDSGIRKIEYNLYERRILGGRYSDGGSTKKVTNEVNLYSYFLKSDWHKKLPIIPTIKFIDGEIIIQESNTEIKVQPIENFKGLESKAVVLLIDRPINDLETFLYVGISRAVYYLNILIDEKVIKYIQRTGRRFTASNNI